MQHSKRALLAAACGLAVALPWSASAQTAWPTKPIRLVVGFPGGSTPDIAARTIADPLAKLLGQPVVVDNKPGASGNIAADTVAKATDDHTLGMVINESPSYLRLSDGAILGSSQVALGASSVDALNRAAVGNALITDTPLVTDPDATIQGAPLPDPATLAGGATDTDGTTPVSNTPPPLTDGLPTPSTH